ncbi:hypothetical protein GJ496_009202 [Pomphorhynchus laevis]|nr:hypothetical protein GJ496_009202 [Pomphorhynchus laevis]
MVSGQYIKKTSRLIPCEISRQKEYPRPDRWLRILRDFIILQSAYLLSGEILQSTFIVYFHCFSTYSKIKKSIANENISNRVIQADLVESKLASLFWIQPTENLQLNAIIFAAGLIFQILCSLLLIRVVCNINICFRKTIDRVYSSTSEKQDFLNFRQENRQIIPIILIVIVILIVVLCGSYSTYIFGKATLQKHQIVRRAAVNNLIQQTLSKAMYLDDVKAEHSLIYLEHAYNCCHKVEQQQKQSKHQEAIEESAELRRRGSTNWKCSFHRLKKKKQSPNILSVLNTNRDQLYTTEIVSCQVAVVERISQYMQYMCAYNLLKVFNNIVQIICLIVFLRSVKNKERDTIIFTFLGAYSYIQQQ